MLITQKPTSNSLTKELDEQLIENEDIFKIVSIREIEILNSDQSQNECGACGCGGGCGQGISINRELTNRNINIFRIISVSSANCFEINQYGSLNGIECGACGCNDDPPLSPHKKIDLG